MTDTPTLIKQLYRESNEQDKNAHDRLKNLLWNAAQALEAHGEVLQSFIDDEIEYMQMNKLGDAEVQHNIKWAREVMGTKRGQQRISDGKQK